MPVYNKTPLCRVFSLLLPITLLNILSPNSKLLRYGGPRGHLLMPPITSLAVSLLATVLHCTADSLAECRELLLHIEPFVICEHHGESDAVPPTQSLRQLLQATDSAGREHTHGTKERSAMVILPPTSHSCFERTFSSTPMTRIASFW